MKITTLLENDTIDRAFKPAHGLSLYIETKNHKILFDAGPNRIFLKNAKKMGIDLRKTDTMILSHGHYDHGGGLSSYMKINDLAKIYVSKEAFKKHVKKIGDKYLDIGVKQPKNTSRMAFLDKNMKIDDELEIFVSIPFKDQIVNDPSLMCFDNDGYIVETFDHEIFLSITEDDKRVLISGCSHKGIEHIIETIEETTKCQFTYVIGGYHFSHFNPEDEEQKEYLTNLSKKFKARQNTTFYSCHCTGEKAFELMKNEMGEELIRIKTGTVLEI